MNISALGVALALLTAAATAAEPTQVSVEKSATTFVSTQIGVPVDGRFSKNPAGPEAGKAQIDIDLASIHTGSAMAIPASN